MNKAAFSQKLFISLLFAGSVLLSACGSDSSSGMGADIVDSGGGNEEPTGPVSYSQKIAPIFQASCSGSGCHINNAKNGVNLTTYAQVMSSLGTKYNSLIVISGNASGSPIIDKLGNSPQFGSRMPDGGSALSNAQVTLIRTWINEGALNN